MKDPKGAVIHSASKDREGDFVFNVDMGGEYAFCFSNQMSTVTGKVIQFEIDIQGSAQDAPEKTAVDNSLSKIRDSVDKIHKTQNYFKTRETVSFFFWESLFSSPPL